MGYSRSTPSKIFIVESLTKKKKKKKLYKVRLQVKKKEISFLVDTVWQNNDA